MARCKVCQGELELETKSDSTGQFTAVLLSCSSCGQIIDRKYYAGKEQLK